MEKYRKLTLTEYLRAVAWKKQRERMDKKAREDFVRDEGLEAGRKEGEAIGYNRAMETMARKMKQRGDPLERIIEDTRLSVGEVDRL